MAMRKDEKMAMLFQEVDNKVSSRQDHSQHVLFQESRDCVYCLVSWCSNLVVIAYLCDMYVNACPYSTDLSLNGTARLYTIYPSVNQPRFLDVAHLSFASQFLGFSSGVFTALICCQQCCIDCWVLLMCINMTYLYNSICIHSVTGVAMLSQNQGFRAIKHCNGKSAIQFEDVFSDVRSYKSTFRSGMSQPCWMTSKGTGTKPIGSGESPIFLLVRSFELKLYISYIMLYPHVCWKKTWLKDIFLQSFWGLKNVAACCTSF